MAAPLEAQVPRLFGYGRAHVSNTPNDTDTGTGTIEYLVMGRIPGEPVSRHPVDGPHRRTLLHHLGAVLRTMHDVPTSHLLPSLADTQIDHDGTYLRRRLEAGFTDLIERLDHHPSRWALPVTPHRVAATALAMVPDTFTPVLLHSNPGPTHTFCATDGALSGLIDFGDSYLSHPAMDLHRWPDPADRLALRQGYLHDTPPSTDFDAAWTAAMIYTDMTTIAARPDLVTAATADLVARLHQQGEPILGQHS